MQILRVEGREPGALSDRDRWVAGIGRIRVGQPAAEEGAAAPGAYLPGMTAGVAEPEESRRLFPSGRHVGLSHVAYTREIVAKPSHS